MNKHIITYGKHGVRGFYRRQTIKWYHWNLAGLLGIFVLKTAICCVCALFINAATPLLSVLLMLLPYTTV
jgi:hypothetical protein